MAEINARRGRTGWHQRSRRRKAVTTEPPPHHGRPLTTLAAGDDAGSFSFRVDPMAH